MKPYDFIRLVKTYTEIPELTAELIRTFVERIEVFQPEKIPGTRTKKQTICIHWNYIGVLDIPEEKKKRRSLHFCKLRRFL